LTGFLASANVLATTMKHNDSTYLWMAASATIVVFAAVACDDTGLVPAGYPNFVDTVTLHALTGTPISSPSAFDISVGITVRTDQGYPFDFAFDIDSLGAAVILPAGALGLPAEAGLQMSDLTFDEVDRAPYEDFSADTVLTISVGDVFIGRSRNATGNCYYLGQLPRYGKFHVLELDALERAVTFELLVNINCGYRGLEPGFPRS